MSAYDSIAEGLNEAIEFAQDKETGARGHRVAVPNIDVAGIRAQTGLSQSAFAKSIGVAKGREPPRAGRKPPASPTQKGADRSAPF